MYCESTTLTGTNVLTLKYASKKYMLPQLEARCQKFLDENLDHLNVCPLLDQVQFLPPS